MALQHGAAHAASLGDLSALSAFFPRAEHESLPQLAARDNSSATSNAPTVNLFLDAYTDDFSYAASIVTACKDQTVYAVRCTAGPATITVEGLELDPSCGPNAPAVTVTEGPSTFAASSVVATSTAGHDIAVTIAENCVLSGTTAAVCTPTFGLSVDKTSTQTSATTTMSGSEYYRFDVPITAGAEKTASATNACSNAASGLNTRSMAMWALTGVVGLAGFLAAV
ncbi:uncharacterized protein JN550_009529 [Neoarthrinium moseri]|uniref:uncharacterized protein n=1 Tax=Neoarthrinium moseri TaxID=1658444 RepID=UPI001FDE510A|nr:uncharacterized protein JN550_009529 [Neoarthrinium moseri]KAI1863418.1 hypothetical protein JN550_009529 [Neoarthrinium moseri]